MLNQYLVFCDSTPETRKLDLVQPKDQAAEQLQKHEPQKLLNDQEESLVHKWALNQDVVSTRLKINA